MKQFVTILLAAVLLCRQGIAQEFIPLWPAGKMPNNNGLVEKDSLFNERIWKVGTPGLYAFPVPKSENRGTTVLICPGGGYERLSHIYNGFQVARWFNGQGINAFVLIYRLPHQASLQQRALAPVQDAQRAMRLLRAQAARWGLAPARIGVLGTSAGGHVAATLISKMQDVSAIGDSLNTVAYRPDFAVLVSPVISMGTYAHGGSKKHLLGPDPKPQAIAEWSMEQQVGSGAPPTFMVHAVNDSTVPVQNSLLFYQALINAKVPASLHTFPQGGHGIRMYNNPGSTDLFADLLLRWLQEGGWLPAKEH